jgi:hypothetical protein
MPCSGSSCSDARRRCELHRRDLHWLGALPPPFIARTERLGKAFLSAVDNRAVVGPCYPQNVILRSPCPLNPAHAGAMEENSSPPDSESTGPVPADPAPDKPARPAALVRVGSPDTVLAVIPSLLGFHPSRSLVVVGAGPPRGRIEVAFRYDLPEPPDVGAAAKIAAHAGAILARHQYRNSEAILCATCEQAC